MRANADFRLAIISFVSSLPDGLGRTYRVNADVGVSDTKPLIPFLASIFSVVFNCILFITKLNQFYLKN